MYFHCATEPLDPGLAADVAGIAAGVLAIAVGVFAFIPVIIELSLQKTSSADIALRRARRSYSAFDLLLGAVLVLGVAVLVGLTGTLLIHPYLFRAQVALTALGVVLLIAGTTSLGLILRKARSG